MDAMSPRDGKFPIRTLRVDDSDSGVVVEFDVVTSSAEPFRISITGKSGRRTEFRFDLDGNETGSEMVMEPMSSPVKDHDLKPKLRVVR